MINKEKVIEGLELCLKTIDEPDCRKECPYYEACKKYEGRVIFQPLMRDTLTLLKEQEPMVMKLEEVKAFGWDYCYLEEERLPGKEYRSVCGDYALTCITWPCIASMRIQYGDDSYGTKWRCWSAKPTDEQRQAVKWG